MATCDTPGMVTITQNARLCRHKSMAVARGLAIEKPDEPFLVKVCNLANIAYEADIPCLALSSCRGRCAGRCGKTGLIGCPTVRLGRLRVEQPQW